MGAGKTAFAQGLALGLGQPQHPLGEVAVAAAAIEREGAVAQPPQRAVGDQLWDAPTVGEQPEDEPPAGERVLARAAGPETCGSDGTAAG